MEIIKTLASYIDEELGDSQKYAKKALCYKTENPQLAQLFYQLSIEEMDHMNRLHSEVEKIIAKHMESGDETPGGMKLAYEILHNRAIEWAKEIKMLQSMYRE